MATNNSTTYSVYRIVCFATGKCYVGQTINPKQRKSEHFASLKNRRHSNNKLQNAYNKYGVGNFYFEVLEDAVSALLINEREKYWVSNFDSLRNGYNRDEGGRAYPNPRTVGCIWNNVQYSSIAEAARAAGVHENTLRRWLRFGLKQDSDTYGLRRAIPVIWNGINYSSITHAARSIHIDRKVMEYYLDQGWQFDADVNHRKIQCIWNGIEYSSIREAARACGVTDSGMKRRLKKGHTCDQDMKAVDCEPKD